MAWTTPKTDFGAETLTAAQVNAIGENLEALKDPPQGNELSSLSGSTSSTSYADMDGTNLSKSITITGDTIEVIFVGTFYNNTVGSINYLEVDIDGTAVFECFRESVSTGTAYFPISFSIYVDGLSAGAHTVKMRWRTTSGTFVWQGGTAITAFSAREA